MVETITPVVHGGRRGRYRWSVALHVLGTTLSAAAFGLVLGAIGALIGSGVDTRIMIGVVIAVAIIYFAREAFRLPVPIPDRHRQVPEWWRTFFSPPVAALLYGFGLGIGFFTFLSYGTFVAVTAGAVAVADPLKGLLVVAPFGLARGLSVVISSRAASAGDVDAVLDRLDTLAITRVPSLINAVALAGIAGAGLLAL